MVYGYHVVFGAYGFWLPNDPRGSWSDFVGSWELYRFGEATTTNTRCSVAQQPHNREAREAAKQTLLYPPVQFNGTQARAIGRGFAESIQKGGVTIWSCAILPEHIHLVIARHTSKVEQVVNFLKGAATKQLLKEGIHPFQELRTPKGKLPKSFARGAWQVYLDNARAIDRANHYVEGNPEKEGKPRQRWHFVTPFDPAALEMV